MSCSGANWAVPLGTYNTITRKILCIQLLITGISTATLHRNSPAPYTFSPPSTVSTVHLCPHYIPCVYPISTILHTLTLDSCPSMSEFLYSFSLPHPCDRIMAAFSLSRFLANSHHKPGSSSSPHPMILAVVRWTSAHEFLNVHE
jgi:hypothetical protein